MKRLFFLFFISLITHSFSVERRTNQLEFKRAGSFTEEESQNKRRRIERRQGELHRAAENGDIEYITQLLHPLKGTPANPNRPDEHGMTAAHYAVIEGYVTVLAALKNDPRTNFSQQDDKGQTPLHLACSLGHKNCAKKLLSYDVQLDLLNNTNHTPLEVAELAGRLKCQRLIQEHKAKNSCSRSKHLEQAKQQKSEESIRSAAAAAQAEQDKCPICQDEISENSVFLFTCQHPLCAECSEGEAAKYLQCFSCQSPLKKSLTKEEKEALEKDEQRRKIQAEEEASEAEVLKLLAEEYAHFI